MSEALAIVRREFGMEAVILNTRHITHRRLIPFLKPREEVEITAGISLQPKAEPARVAVETRPAAAARTAAAPKVQAAPVSAPRPANSGSEIVTGVSKAAQIAAELERRQADKLKLDESLKSLERMTARNSPPPTATPRNRMPNDVGLDVDSHIGDAARRISESMFHTDREEASKAPPASHRDNSSSPYPKPANSQRHNGAARIDRQTSAEAVAPKTSDEPPNQAAHLAAAMQMQSNAPQQSAHVNELTAKLDALQKMVENLTKSTQFRHHDEVPTELFDIYTRMIDAEIEDALAREFVFRLREHCSPDQLQDSTATLATLSGLVESDIKCANPIRAMAGRRKVVALVGPTGVGKTTTIAKLAANFRLRDGIRMGLVTVDTYRIAAVEQLRTYAEIIDLPMKVVTSPQDMRRALDDLTGLDLVLIDTAGRSPRDDLKIQELKSLLGEASVDEVHLVMSLTASVRSILMTAEQFKAVNPTAMVLTKLDEAAGMGSLLSVSRQVQLPISYVTTGQDVPDDIEPANASRLSRLVLGEDRLLA